ncbi:MAG: hypothetical protein ACRDH0_13730 [Actinomycetota bacterium]
MKTEPFSEARFACVTGALGPDRESKTSAHRPAGREDPPDG